MNFRKALMTMGALAAMAVTGNASSAGIVNVPFTFKYLKTEMPAGRYQFHYADSPSAIMLTNIDTRTTIQVAVPAGRSTKPMRLVFDQTGDDHVLKSVK
jgi:hypothetical protein